MNIAIILSGGIGTRMGVECPKQYIEIDDKPIISYCIDAFVNNGRIDKFIIVVADEWKDYVKHILKDIKQPIYYAQPGETRQFSIYDYLIDIIYRFEQYPLSAALNASQTGIPLSLYTLRLNIIQ